jgi:hypothetical protein
MVDQQAGERAGEQAVKFRDLFKRAPESARVAKLEKKLVERDGSRVLLVAKAIHAGQRPAGRVWWDELAPLTRAERQYVFQKLREWRR